MAVEPIGEIQVPSFFRKDGRRIGWWEPRGDKQEGKKGGIRKQGSN